MFDMIGGFPRPEQPWLPSTPIIRAPYPSTTSSLCKASISGKKDKVANYAKLLKEISVFLLLTQGVRRTTDTRRKAMKIISLLVVMSVAFVFGDHANIEKS